MAILAPPAFAQADINPAGPPQPAAPIAASVAPAASVAATAASASDPPPDIPVNTLSLMAGIYTTSFWQRSFNFNGVGHEPNFVIAVISGKDLVTTSWGLRIGHESGLALRFGKDFSVEIWRGITISFNARLVGRITLTPQLTLGLSAITNAIGVEVPREAAVTDGDMKSLIYLGSQLSVVLERFPYLEVFYRLHHRSGALGFWGNLPDGHNANAVGIQLRY